MGEHTAAIVPNREAFVMPLPGQNGAVPGRLTGKTVVLTGIFPEAGGGAGLELGKAKVSVKSREQTKEKSVPAPALPAHASSPATALLCQNVTIIRSRLAWKALADVSRPRCPARRTFSSSVRDIKSFYARLLSLSGYPSDLLTLFAQAKIRAFRK